MAYDTLASAESMAKTIASLAAVNVQAEEVENGAAALERIKVLIPAAVSVMNGASTTLDQIGYVDFLKSGTHPWNNLKDGILKETDPAKQAILRQHSVVSDYYLGSIHAVAESGELVWGSNSGSQLPHIAFTSQNLIFVVGEQKITPTLDEALKRLREYVVPLEDARMKSTGAPGTFLSKIYIAQKEQPFMQRNVQIIFVKEKLGF